MSSQQIKAEKWKLQYKIENLSAVAFASEEKQERKFKQDAYCTSMDK